MDPDARLRAEDVMSTPVVRIDPDARLREAAAQMTEAGISALVVTNVPPGIVTTTDLVAAIGDGIDPEAATVAAVVTESITTVSLDCTLRSAADRMTDEGIKHLPVADESGEVVGMLSSTDVAAYLPRYEPPA